NAALAVHGKQGHAAYPDLADNPLTRLVRLLAEAIGTELDRGSDWFAPSSLQVTSIDVGNAAANVIPGEAVCRLNIRFNDRHTGAALSGWLRD
ncbi:peptidase dimerization domain-containing protein, partial [Escherichia coli]